MSLVGTDIVAFDGLFLVDDIAGPEVFLENSAEMLEADAVLAGLFLVEDLVQ